MACETRKKFLELLRSQGVTDKDVMRGHLSFLNETLRVKPTFNPSREYVAYPFLPFPYMG